MFYPLQIHELRRSLRIPAPLETAFEFFSDINNLDRITPPWLDFRILSPQPVQMQQGALIDFSLKIYGIRLAWKTEISEWQPPLRFIDKQIKGPYMVWIHEHHFEAGENSTIMEDVVKYAVPGFIFEPLIHLGLVKHRLKKIFDYREKTILETFSK